MVDHTFIFPRRKARKRMSRSMITSRISSIQPEHQGRFRVANKPQKGYHTRMRKLEEELKLLTAFSSDMVYRLRYDTMRYEYISPAVQRLLGFSSDEMRQINFRSLIVETRLITDGMHRIESFDGLEEARRAGDVNKWQADYLLRTKDGSRIWVSDVSYPWLDEQGNLIGSIGTLRDITDRVELERQAEQDLQELANTDPLTNLPNRQVFFAELDRELKRINRSGDEVSILLLDIDKFKAINDAHGHHIGDAVLMEVAMVIRECLRDIDIVARIGGEEFGVILPDTNTGGGLWAAERIRQSVAGHHFIVGTDQAPVTCKVSIGVASATMEDDRDSSELFKIADTRLYIAKQTGRNQVSVDEVLRTH